MLVGMADAGGKSMTASSDVERLTRTFQTVLAPENRSTYDHADGWLYRYYGGLREPGQAHTFVRKLRALLGDRWDHRGELRFVDVGCGFGFMAAALALLGARSVVGVEASPGCFATCTEMRKLVPDLRLEFYNSRAEHLPLEDASADVVLCIEAISHFIEPLRFLDEAWRVVSPGGVVVVSDDNNEANPKVRRETHEVWNRFENGPPAADFHGHRIRKSYCDIRGDIIRSAFPQAAGADVERLAKATSGLWGRALMDAVAIYFDSGQSPESYYRYGTCPVEPRDGAYCENLLDPRALAAHLERKGGRAIAKPYFGGETRGGAVALVNTTLQRVLPYSLGMRFASGFRLYAWK